MTEPAREYLGDGAYVAFDGFAFVVTTSNGIVDTNTIYLEPEHLQNLITFAERMLGRAFRHEPRAAAQSE